MKISAAIIDTYPDKKFASLAIKMVQRLPFIKNIITFTDTPFSEIENIKFIHTPPLKSNNEYGQVIFEKLPDIITDERVLIFQWDGFPINPNKWKDEFLNYDYIGAPSGSWMGNGGFSLRSKKLLHTLRDLNISVDLSNPFDQPEDQIICTHKRSLLEVNGIKFAPVDIASQFSFESGLTNKNVFGFHAPFNLPIFFNESDLIRYADNIIPRISQPTSMVPYLNCCLQQKMYELLRITLSNYQNKPSILKAFQYLSATNPNSPLLKFFVDSTAQNKL